MYEYLKELFCGNIRPAETLANHTPISKVAEPSFCEKENLFLSELSSKKKKEYLELSSFQSLLEWEAQSAAFVEGVRFGAKFILDVLK